MAAQIRDIAKKAVSTMNASPKDEAREHSEIRLPFEMPLGDDVVMFYLNITKPLDWKPPVWMIDRDEYHKIMVSKRLKTREYLGEVENKEAKWVPLQGKMVLPWVYKVDMSAFVKYLLAKGFLLVGTEQGMAKNSKSRKVWISFVAGKYYRPPIPEFAALKKTVLEWMEKEMFSSNKRMNITIFINPLLRKGEVDPTAVSVAITIDQDHFTSKQFGGLNLQLENNRLVLDRGPAQH